MAITKEVNIVVKESGMDKVNQSIQQLENSIEQTELKTKSFKTQMREANEQVRLMSQRFGETSIQAVQAARRVAELKDQMDLANDLVKSFNPDQKFKALGAATQVAGTGLQGVTAGVALLGDESEDTQKALLQVQAAMSFSDAISNLSNLGDQWKVLKTTIMANTVVTKIATTVQKLWNLAMAANPIGALVAVISLAIAGIAGLVSWFIKSSNANEKAMNATKKNSDALKKQTEVTEKNAIALKTNNDQQYELAKASGKSSEELRKLNIKHAQETIALNVKNAELARGTFLRERDTLAMLEASGASDEVIEKQKELTQKSYEELKKQNENIKKSSEEYKAIRRQNEVEIVNEKTESNKKAIEDGKTASEKSIEAQKKADEKQAELIKSRFENENNFIAEQLKNEQLSIDEKRNIVLASQELSKEDRQKFLGDLQNQEIEKEKEHNQKIIDLNKKFDEEKAQRLADTAVKKEELDYENQVKEIELLAQTELEKQTLIEKLNAEHLVRMGVAKKTDREKELEEEKKAADKKKLYAETLAQQQTDFANNVFAIGASLAKKGSKVAKGVAIAQATMNTYQGVTKALAETTDPTPSQTLRFANAAAVGIMGAINIAKIASSREDGGSAGGMGGGGGATPQAPSFNLVQGTGRNQLAESIGQQAPVKAFVVARDMSTGQEMDRNIIKSASL